MAKIINIPNTRQGMTKREWIKWLKNNLQNSYDFNNFFDLLSLQIMSVLLENNAIKIPGIGTFRINVYEAKKPYYSFYYNKIMFPEPKSQLVFKPDTNFVQLFDNVKLTLQDIEQIKDGVFDWFEKARTK